MSGADATAPGGAVTPSPRPYPTHGSRPPDHRPLQDGPVRDEVNLRVGDADLALDLRAVGHRRRVGPGHVRQGRLPGRSYLYPATPLLGAAARGRRGSREVRPESRLRQGMRQSDQRIDWARRDGGEVGRRAYRPNERPQSMVPYPFVRRRAAGTNAGSSAGQWATSKTLPEPAGRSSESGRRSRPAPSVLGSSTR